MRRFVSVMYRPFYRESRAYILLKYLSIFTLFTFAYIWYCSVSADVVVDHIIDYPNGDLSLHQISSNYYISYPGSRCFEELQQIQLFSLNPNNPVDTLSHHSRSRTLLTFNTSSVTQRLIKNELVPFSESSFQEFNFPILWLDSSGDVHWNVAAEREAYGYLIQKQFPSLAKSLTSEDLAGSYVQDCQLRQVLILEQWRNGGFLSRLNCLIEQFGQSLYTPTMAILGPRKFSAKGSVEEDFLEEGILDYISSISRCSAYLYHPAMLNTRETIYNIVSNIHQKTQSLEINTFQQLRARSKLPFLYLPEIWKFGYEHVPHRRWLFDFDRKRALDVVHYDSSKTTLTQHKKEHIYVSSNLRFNLSTWEPNNSPFYPSKEPLHSDYTITWKDKVFTSFIRYMITLYVHHFPPRIQTLTNLLALHWTRYLGDKNRQPYNLSLNTMAGIFVRRGDKMPEDSFWLKHKYWRNVSYYVKGIVDEEKRRNKTFASIFIMTDDAEVMNSILQYATIKSNSSDEAYARHWLYGRQILYNVFAPQSCFNPFVRIGFDQFLVSLNFLVEHTSFIVSHNDSNVGRYLERVVYAKRQTKGNETFRTTDFVRNAPDSFDA